MKQFLFCVLESSLSIDSFAAEWGHPFNCYLTLELRIHFMFRIWSVELAPLDHLESDWFISCKKNHCICWSVLVIIKSWYLFGETLAHVCNCFLLHWYRQFDSFEPSNESTIWTESRSTASSHLDILDDMRFKFEQYQNTWCNHRRICEVYKPRNKLASFQQ
jgi:hypothetical protein